MPVLDVDAISIALTLEQRFTFALDLVYKMLHGTKPKPAPNGCTSESSLSTDYLCFVT